MKKYCLLFFIAVITTATVQSQTIERKVISSGGNDAKTPSGTQVTGTFGEPLIETRETPGGYLTEGFQQPDTIYLPEVNLHIYTGITPNGDGINDVWYIEGIEQYPVNSVTIFNRWEQQVWRGENYDNVNVVWEGNSSTGASLPSGTYFFVFTAPGIDPQKGWVQLTR
ncbi:MAG: gliding motility-associated C-terminal domain-containing protein [Bacteroidetes bacterium]|nr:MAG: gliding motility-associated C-terminal domain-containing protein [Bacteroidota bacterium]